MAYSLQTSSSEPQDDIIVVEMLLRSISWNNGCNLIISSGQVVEGVVEEELHVEQQVPQLAKKQADVKGIEIKKQNDIQEQSICNIQSY